MGDPLYIVMPTTTSVVGNCCCVCHCEDREAPETRREVNVVASDWFISQEFVVFFPTGFFCMATFVYQVSRSLPADFSFFPSFILCKLIFPFCLELGVIYEDWKGVGG